MRIGIITGEYPPMQGGVGAYTSILAAELARQGEQVAILSSRQARNPNPQIALSNSIDRWSFANLNAIRHWVKALELDVVNLQFQTAAYSMSPWIHLLPDMIRTVPIVTTFHDLRFPYLFPKAGKLRQWMVMHLAKASQGAILTNHEDYERVGGVVQSKLIPIGSNILNNLPDDFDESHWREKAGVQPDDFLIAYFGLINRSKGLETLIQSLYDLRKNKVPAQLVMVGGGTGSSDLTNEAYFNEIRNLINRLSLPKYIHWTGYLQDESEVGAYLTASDVVALPFLDGASYRRGSLMAAIRYGCAILTTTPSVDIPLFCDGENMALVPPDKSDALTGRLRQLYESPEKRQELQDGAAQLSRQFEWSQIASAYIEFFQQVTA